MITGLIIRSSEEIAITSTLEHRRQNSLSSDNSAVVRLLAGAGVVAFED
jgi:hypothetical protein